MPYPSQLVLYYHCLHAGGAGFIKDAVCSSQVLPLDTKDPSDAPVMEFFESLQVVGVGNLGFRAVEESW